MQTMRSNDLGDFYIISLRTVLKRICQISLWMLCKFKHGQYIPLCSMVASKLRVAELYN